MRLNLFGLSFFLCEEVKGGKTAIIGIGDDTTGKGYAIYSEED